MGCLTVGVDLGQASDPSAIAVTERGADCSNIRHLERIRLGTPYPKVCERIGAVCSALPGSSLIVDGTGVGRAVVDSLEALGLSPWIVFITAGKKVRREGFRLWVPKSILLRPLITGLENGSIRIAKGLTEAAALKDELKKFTVTRGERGHSSYEGVGAHDDLVISAALSLFEPSSYPDLTNLGTGDGSIEGVS